MRVDDNKINFAAIFLNGFLRTFLLVVMCESSSLFKAYFGSFLSIQACDSDFSEKMVS